MKKRLIIIGLFSILSIMFLIGVVLADSENSGGNSNSEMNNNAEANNGTKNNVETNIEREFNQETGTFMTTKEITAQRGNITRTKTITRTCSAEEASCEINKEVIIERTDKNQTIIRTQSRIVTLNREIEIDEENRTYVNMNGTRREFKIMPDTAAERALERLRLKVCNESNNCTIILKETGIGNQTRLKYEIRARERVKFFWFFSRMKNFQAEVDAESGEVN